MSVSASGSAVDADLLAKELYALLGSKRVSVSEADRDTYARDMWPRMLLARRQGLPETLRPTAIVWPENTSEVVAIIKLALRLRVPIVPYGGGSGVCGGVVPLFGGITIDTKRMQAFRSVRQDELLCDVEAGIGGERFERELARRGFTFGHFPSSIYGSTVGGWLATRAAGQLSTKYGKVEDRVAGLTVVTGRGEVIETDGPNRALRGPHWTQLLVGSEGTLGIITSARLRVSPTPQISIFRGFEVESVSDGIHAIRSVLQLGLRPAVVRLYDELDTLLNSFSHQTDEESLEATLAEEHLHRYAPSEPGRGAVPRWPSPQPPPLGIFDRIKKFASDRSNNLRKDAMMSGLSHAAMFHRLADTITGKVANRGCRLIIGLEGARIRTEVEAALTFAELENVGAKDMGEQPGLSWLAHRYAVSYKMSPMFRDGAFVDTMEVASRWDNLQELYDAVRAAISKHAVVMAHFSHAYADGCSIYFTFAATAPAGNLRAAESLYDTIWRDGLSAATRVGGTISHHHGVGLLKAPYMEGEHREAMAVYRALKSSFDPAGILNPGKMGLQARIADSALEIRRRAPTDAPMTLPFDEAKP